MRTARSASVGSPVVWLRDFARVDDPHARTERRLFRRAFIGRRVGKDSDNRADHWQRWFGRRLRPLDGDRRLWRRRTRHCIALSRAQLAPHPASYVIVGMAGFFAAAAKTPFSTLVMVSEASAGHGAGHLSSPNGVCVHLAASVDAGPQVAGDGDRPVLPRRCDTVPAIADGDTVPATVLTI